MIILRTITDCRHQIHRGLLVFSFVFVFLAVSPSLEQKSRRPPNRPPSIESFTSSSTTIQICPFFHAFDPSQLTSSGEFEAVGLMHSAAGPPIKIDGLWALQFGHGTTANSANGLTTTLFFTAGPEEEEHGLFGSLVPVPPPGRQ